MEEEEEEMRRRRRRGGRGENLKKRIKNDSSHTLIPLSIINGIVWLAWKKSSTSINSLSYFMDKYFIHKYNSHPITMLTSCFSHQSLLHLSFNMFALNSFGSMLYDDLGGPYGFLAFYLSSGLISSLGSRIIKTRMNTAYRGSLGASGGIFSLLGAAANLHPHNNVGVMFIPGVSVPMGIGVPVLMGYDLFGLYKASSTLDHGAHLSGALNGYFLSYLHLKFWNK